MVSNVDANISKKCKRKMQTVADFRNKINFLNCPKINTQKSWDKDSKKSVEDSRCDIIGKSVNGADLTGRKPSTSDMRQCNDESEVCSTINEYEFDREINHSSFNSKIVRPSLFGSTMRIGNLDRKSTRRIYRRKINHYKALIRILINVRAKDLSNTIVQENMRFSRGYDDPEFAGNIPATEFSNEKPDVVTESGEKNGILFAKGGETDVQTPGPEYAARKSVELGKTSGKIFDKDVSASTSENVCNDESENFDDKSTDCEMSFGGNRESDIDSTIPIKTDAPNKHSKSLDKIADQKAGEDTASEIWLQKCLGPVEFNDSDVSVDSRRESVKDKNILDAVKKTERLSSSMKKEQKIRCVEFEGDPPCTVNKNVKLSPPIGGGKKPSPKKTEQRNSGKNGIENIAVCIPDLAKGAAKISGVSLKGGTKSKKDEGAGNASRKSEARNTDQPEFIVKSKPTGNHCSCKRTKFRHVKTSAYSVPEIIEYPGSSIRERYGNRSVAAAVKSFENTTDEGKISVIGVKKTANFYSPLELKYSDKMQSKLDPDHVSNNQSKPIDNDSSEVQGSLLEAKKITMKKSARRVSAPLKKFSLSNFTLSNNSSKNDTAETECGINNSKSLKIPRFSKYSIPVSIEINIAKDDLRKRSLSMNLIQSKITRYFSPSKGNLVPGKISNLNSTRDIDDNGNRIERNNTVVARSKSKTRSLPIIESDVLLKDKEKVIYLKNIHDKPKLSIPRGDYLYGVLNESGTTAASNQNTIYRENIISPISSGNKKSLHSQELICIDDSNSSAESVVPPSYSIFSDDSNYKSIIDINKMLDTQQREDLLTPWEGVSIYEKINHWHDDTFEL